MKLKSQQNLILIPSTDHLTVQQSLVKRSLNTSFTKVRRTSEVWFFQPGDFSNNLDYFKKNEKGSRHCNVPLQYDSFEK